MGFATIIGMYKFLLVKDFGAIKSNKGGNAPQATDLPRQRNKSSASHITLVIIKYSITVRRYVLYIELGRIVEFFLGVVL